MSQYNKVAKGLVLRSRQQDSECLFDGTKLGQIGVIWAYMTTSTTG